MIYGIYRTSGRGFRLEYGGLSAILPRHNGVPAPSPAPNTAIIVRARAIFSILCAKPLLITATSAGWITIIGIKPSRLARAT